MAHYLEYARHNEAPLMFHVWGGITCLSAATGRRVWLPKGEGEELFPNTYTIYVGAAGNGKSSAMNKVSRLLAELPTVTDSVSYSVETVPGFLRYIAGEPNAKIPIPSPVKFQTVWPDGQLRDVHPMTIIANEFINFIGKDQEGWIGFLNDVYDRDRYGYRTKNMGKDYMTGPYVVLLGALTTQVSFELQRSKIIESGFARRTFFQFGERQLDNPHPFPSEGEHIVAARVAALAHLRRVVNARGAFQWGEGVREWWSDWYCQHSREIPFKPQNVVGWYNSKPDQVLRVAMLLALSESNALVLTVDHITLALSYIAAMETELHRVFGGIGRNELASVASRIGDMIEGSPAVWTANTLRTEFFSHCTGQEFDICIDHLVASERISRKSVVLGPINETLIARPAVLAEFVSTLAQHSDVARIVTFLDCVPSLRLLAARLRGLDATAAEPNQAAAQPSNETANGIPHWEPKEGG